MEKLVPKSSHRKKERPSRKRPQQLAGQKSSKHRAGSRIQVVKRVDFTSTADVVEDRKRPQLVNISLCDLISLEQSGKVNLMGCFDRIFRDKKTKTTGNFYLYVRTAETRTGHINITFLTQKNVPILQVGYDIEIRDTEPPLDKPLHTQFHSRMSFIAKEKGVYWVDVTYNGQSLGGRVLTISDFGDEDGKKNEHSNI